VGRSSTYSVTELLTRWREGDAAARDALVPLVYQELRRLARKCLAGQPSDHTLQPTALVHEAYLRLAEREKMHFENRAHFLAVLTRIMRQILIDHARGRNAAKRDARIKVALDDAMLANPVPEISVIVLDEAVRKLSRLDARQAQIMELRFLGGLSVEETALVLDISPATVKREWMTARLWLQRQLARRSQS
jgi:RNA polymerase sigma factor (TIGR02999 family)